MVAAVKGIMKQQCGGRTILGLDGSRPEALVASAAAKRSAVCRDVRSVLSRRLFLSCDDKLENTTARFRLLSVLRMLIQ